MGKDWFGFDCTQMVGAKVGGQRRTEKPKGEAKRKLVCEGRGAVHGWLRAARAQKQVQHLYLLVRLGASRAQERPM